MHGNRETTKMKSKILMKSVKALMQELETYQNYKKLVKTEINEIEKLYIAGKINAIKKDKLIYQHLKGKTVLAVEKQYDAYIDSLKGQIKNVISQIFYDVYYDKSTPKVAMVTDKDIKAIDEKVTSIKQSVDTKEVVKKLEGVENEVSKLKKASKKPVKSPLPHEKKQASKILKINRKLEPEKPVMIKPEKVSEPDFVKETEAEQVDYTPNAEDVTYITPRSRNKEEKKGFIVGEGQEQFLTKKKNKKSKKKMELEVPEFIEKKLAERTFLAEKTEIPSELMELEKLRKEAGKSKIQIATNPELLKEEAKRVRKEIESKKPEHIYKPSKIGAISNLFVRPVGNFFVRKYPTLFEQLYSVLRPANIRVLSNTYVNIIIFLTLIATVLSGIFFFFLFLFTTYSFGELFIKTVLMSLFMGIVTLIISYSYPFMRVSERKKNMDVNMPFAVNHMSAIAASGISPAKLFELAAQSEEYGELNHEFKKIVEYLNMFGYDLTTALDDVAQNTPSEKFKDLLEGLNATLQSGGNIQEYLDAKTNETIDEYKITQQKHIETISAYSDIYTGILIAAPLFFISILSLVSILGGTIGGFPVQVVISAGTYLLIPILNVGFLLFLHLGQQEV